MTSGGAEAAAHMERRVLTADDEIEALAPEWRRLAASAAMSPFASPDWLIPWWAAYRGHDEARLLAFREHGSLVGVAPLFRRVASGRRFRLREMGFWGRTATPISGGVDILVAPSAVEPVVESFLEWLRAEAEPWDAFHYLRSPTASPVPAALVAAAAGAGWRSLDLTGEIQSIAMTIDLPEAGSDWTGYLGSKARRNIRRELRIFGEKFEGRIEVDRRPESASTVVAELERLMARRWGDDERYFRADPAFGGFATSALARMLAERSALVVLARDRDGIAGLLVTLHLNSRAVALLIGLTTDPRYRTLSLGKALFERAIDESVALGCRSFDFLWAGAYKEDFWHARGRIHRSGIVARGRAGGLVAARVAARRAGKSVWRRLPGRPLRDGGRGS